MTAQYSYAELRQMPAVVRDNPPKLPPPTCKMGLSTHIVAIGCGYQCNHCMRAITEEEVRQGACRGCD